MKFSIVSVSFLLSALFLAHISYSADICPAPVPEKYQHVQPGNVVAAYFASWDTYGNNKYQVSDIAPIASELTHIIYAFAKPNAQTGSCELFDAWADIGANQERRKKVGGNFLKLIELKKKFPHIKVLLSIGGGAHSKEISEIARNGMMKQFVQSCIELLDHWKYHYKNSKTGEQEVIDFEYEGLFDGLDFDWEWLNNIVPAKEAKSFENAIVLFKKLLNERSKKQKKRSLLTVALQVNPRVYNALPLSSCAKFIDWFHVMAYNFTTTGCAGTGFNAPICNTWSSLSIDNSIAGLMHINISPSKLVLGIPLYGHVFEKTQPKLGSSFVKTPSTGSLSYDQIKKIYLNKTSCSYKWHDKSKVPYLYCPHDEIFVSFDDERSVKEKVTYAELKRLRGVVFWKLSGDDDSHTLIKAVS